MSETGTQTDRGGLARLLATRRRRVLLALALALIGVRAVLPSVLRPWLLARADAALVGFVELEALDLSLLRGGVTLHGLSVHADERPGEAPPVFTARRLWTQISWLALLARTLEIEELALDDFTVHVDRLDTGLRLPRPVEASEPEPEPEQTEAEAAAPDADARRWSFAADGIALRNGRLELVDHTLAREPQTFALTLDDLEARELAVRTSNEDGEPGRIAIEAQLETGRLSLSSWVEPYEDGLDVRSTLVLDDLPIDKLRAYLTAFGWSALAGRLDARIDHRFVSGGAHEVSGEVALVDLLVEVPGEPEAALAWKSLGVVVDRVDLAARHAEIAHITSTGATLLVEPRADAPLPLLRGPAAPAERPQEDVAAQAGEDAATEPGESAWTWRVGAARLEDAVVALRGGPEPVRLALDAELGPLSSERASRAPLALRVGNEPGSLTLAGELAPAPLAFAGRLVARDLALPPLLAQIDAPAVHWVRDGILRADLQLVLARDLRASGTLGLAGLELDEPSTAKQFRVAWKDLELGLRRLDFRGLMPAPGDPDRAAPGGDARALDVVLSRLALASPRIVLTRGEAGLVIPPLEPPTPGEAGEPAEGADAARRSGDGDRDGGGAGGGDGEDEGAGGEASALPITLALGEARIADGRVQLNDPTLEPAYRGQIRAIALQARNGRWPERSVESLELRAEGLRGARLSLTGALHPDEQTRLELELVELPLEQFKAYVAPTGYVLQGGTLSLDSNVELSPTKIASRNRVVVASLGLAGAEGEAAFLENFGIPLSVALGLLEDLDGRIKLAIPIAGEPANMKVGLGGLIAQALRKALIGALSAPLKLLGAVTRDGEIADPSPAPVRFTVGDASLADDEDERLDEIASLLASSPGIFLRLAGQTSEADDRLLCERALLEQLEASRGVRALSALGELARRRAVREHLAKRLSGGSPQPLDEDDARWLEDQLARARAPIEALEALAAQRAETLRERLVEGWGVDPDRLVLDPPRTAPPAPEPGVAIAIDAQRTPAAPRETTYRPGAAGASPQGGTGWEG